MNNSSERLSGLRVVFLTSFVLFLTACSGSGDAVVIAEADDELLDISSSGASSANYNLWDLIDTLPYEHLNDAELEALSYMREEEKLARDVYLYLYDIWDTPIFNNIADAEQTHMDAVLRVIQKYDLADPAQSTQPGIFSDPTLQGLYDSLTAQGAASLIDGYLVGATIEDLDIYDLRRSLALVDNEDITVVFENLEKGSRNHMRAFTGRLTDLGMVYSPTYISQEEYDSIINSPMETGP